MLHDHDISLHSLATCNPYRDEMYPPNRAVLQSIRADINFTSFMLPTKEEIKDRGKSDWLAKSLVLLQTSWFVMQCIACAIEHLPVTHLKIVMLAYAAMNFVIYIFWWNKPLNVYRPVQVFQKSELSAMQSRAQGTEPTWYRDIDVRGIVLYITGNQDDNNNLEYEERVPRFWANSDETDVERADKIVLGVGVCFGAIHCIAWGFSFLMISLSTQYEREPLYFHISNVSHWHRLIAMHCTNAVPPAAYASLRDCLLTLRIQVTYLLSTILMQGSCFAT